MLPSVLVNIPWYFFLFRLSDFWFRLTFSLIDIMSGNLRSCRACSLFIFSLFYLFFFSVISTLHRRTYLLWCRIPFCICSVCISQTRLPILYIEVFESSTTVQLHENYNEGFLHMFRLISASLLDDQIGKMCVWICFLKRIVRVNDENSNTYTHKHGGITLFL